MEEYSEQQLNDIVKGFLDRTLNKSLWTHQAHIVTAIWHLMKFDKEDALCRLRSGIISYNLAVGGENTGQNGYHETMTVFWWEIIHQYLAGRNDVSYRENCITFLHSPMSDKNFPFQFYSRERILSPAARSKFTDPDLKEIKIV
jgi:hypothetical protein